MKATMIGAEQQCCRRLIQSDSTQMGKDDLKVFNIYPIVKGSLSIFMVSTNFPLVTSSNK